MVDEKENDVITVRGEVALGRTDEREIATALGWPAARVHAALAALISATEIWAAVDPGGAYTGIRTTSASREGPIRP